MDRIADILVILDPTAAAAEQPAIAKAHVLAKHVGAGIELLACDTEYSRETRMAAQWLRPGNEPPGETWSSRTRIIIPRPSVPS